MDGQLGMSEHYYMTDDGRITGAKELRGITQLKSCPTCRGSLRNLSRYGRIVRHTLLEESTKKFIIWSHNKSMDLESRLLDEQERLESSEIEGVLTTVGRQGRLVISGERLHQLLTIDEWVGHGRYSSLIRLYREIAVYVHRVAVEEQPYQRVHDLVQHARRCGHSTGQFLLNPSRLETRGLLLAGSLLLRCDLLILRDFVALHRQANENLTAISINLEVTLNHCNELVELAKEKKYVRHEAEGHIYFTQLVGVVRLLVPGEQLKNAEQLEDRDKLKVEGEKHLVKARSLLDLYKGSTSHLVGELKSAELMLHGAWHDPVSVEEKRNIWSAMSTEFQGQGHWYMCENGHPFTIGECGMPMEEARCPECGAAIGGHHHNLVAGVHQDAEMESFGAWYRGLY
ncbi:putative nf-x1 finger and helicase domain protein [Rosellinia necatrix]|uniref:Putative nf-x1 finger and helicase domain protein n=1 Tax=Rosellinia necatrix TaxID=77044 RepID=A0A1S8AA78_ROSNE|nr:putative nf-x1 finger and helicase domain protein [Rosellinia necatrix]